MTMKTAVHNEPSPGRGRLELLCHTASMHDGDAKLTPPTIESQESSDSLKSSQDDEQVKTLPALSAEPVSPSSFPRIIVTTQSKGTTKWAPRSFVDLKNNRKPSLVPQSPNQKSKMVPLPLHLPLLQGKLQQGLLTSTEPVEHVFSGPTPESAPTFHPQVSKSQHAYKTLISENVQLKIELGDAKKEIAKLKKEMNRANCNISELRSLSGGNKISEIPLVDMIEIMQEYGSEVSGQSFQKRKEDPQPASIVRQFRRWNPDFLKYFCRKNGKWIPKLGKAGELQRRQLKREALRAHRRNPPQGPQERIR